MDTEFTEDQAEDAEKCRLQQGPEWVEPGRGECGNQESGRRRAALLTMLRFRGD